MVRGVVIVDNRGFRFLAAFLFLTLFLAVPAGIKLWSASRHGKGDSLRIGQITSAQQAENERRISEIASIQKQNLLAVDKHTTLYGG